MNEEKEQWMEDVFQSMKGSRRAQPRPTLLAKIENQIAAAKMIPLQKWRYAVAAAALLLFVNVAALLIYQNTGEARSEVAAADAYSESLISSFQIYE